MGPVHVKWEFLFYDLTTNSCMGTTSRHIRQYKRELLGNKRDKSICLSQIALFVLKEYICTPSNSILTTTNGANITYLYRNDRNVYRNTKKYEN